MRASDSMFVFVCVPAGFPYAFECVHLCVCPCECVNTHEAMERQRALSQSTDRLKWKVMLEERCVINNKCWCPMENSSGEVKVLKVSFICDCSA